MSLSYDCDDDDAAEGNNNIISFCRMADKSIVGVPQWYYQFSFLPLNNAISKMLLLDNIFLDFNWNFCRIDWKKWCADNEKKMKQMMSPRHTNNGHCKFQFRFHPLFSSTWHFHHSHGKRLIGSIRLQRFTSQPLMLALKTEPIMKFQIFCFLHIFHSHIRGIRVTPLHVSFDKWEIMQQFRLIIILIVCECVCTTCAAFYAKQFFCVALIMSTGAHAWRVCVC